MKQEYQLFQRLQTYRSKIVNDLLQYMQVTSAENGQSKFDPFFNLKSFSGEKMLFDYCNREFTLIIDINPTSLVLDTYETVRDTEVLPIDKTKTRLVNQLRIVVKERDFVLGFYSYMFFLQDGTIMRKEFAQEYFELIWRYLRSEEDNLIRSMGLANVPLS